MIASLRGTLTLRDPAGLVIEVGGVGYLVEVPLTTFEQLPAAGESVLLHTELVVREDSWQLFGFATPLDRAVFRRLLAATGVGAKLAITMLSTLGTDRLVHAIRDRDLAILASVPGIGRKKAERIALDLADRMDDLPVATERGIAPAGSVARQAVAALVTLGYQAAAAENAVRAVTADGIDTATLIRRALAELGRN
jgi:Holliday junction DNA helicase RuvA